MWCVILSHWGKMRWRCRCLCNITRPIAAVEYRTLCCGEIASPCHHARHCTGLPLSSVAPAPGCLLRDHTVGPKAHLVRRLLKARPSLSYTSHNVHRVLTWICRFTFTHTQQSHTQPHTKVIHMRTHIRMHTHIARTHPSACKAAQTCEQTHNQPIVVL